METEKEVLIFQFSLLGLPLFMFFIALSGGDWMWLSRYGAYLTILGIYLTLNDIEKWKDESLVFTHRKMEDPKSFVVQHAETQRNDSNVKSRIYFASKIYLLIGTVLWGFGDLLNLFR